MTTYLVVATMVNAVLTLTVLAFLRSAERARGRVRSTADQRVQDALSGFIADVDRRLAALDARQDDLLTEAREARKSTEAGTKLLTRQFALVRDRQARLEQVLDAIRRQPNQGRDT